MGQIDNNDFIIKDDGTIVRGPKLEEIKKKLSEKEKAEDKSNNNSTNKNGGCLSTIIAVVFTILLCSIIGGIIGLIINEHDSFEMGLLIGGLFGVFSMVCWAFEEYF